MDSADDCELLDLPGGVDQGVIRQPDNPLESLERPAGIEQRQKVVDRSVAVPRRLRADERVFDVGARNILVGEQPRRGRELNQRCCSYGVLGENVERLRDGEVVPGAPVVDHRAHAGASVDDERQLSEAADVCPPCG
jgi:hypothetical protein